MTTCTKYPIGNNALFEVHSISLVDKQKDMKEKNNF